MMVVIIVLAISIVTAIAQIASSMSSIWETDPLIPSKKKLTKAGIFFYACTVVLVILPTLQTLIQNEAEDKKDKDRTASQELRNEKLRIAYDSALAEMKKKFDTTTNIVSETLGKYGFKLDSTNRALISIKDSAKTRIFTSDDPILILSNADEGEGIIFEGKPQPDVYKFRVGLKSNDAGSAYFDVMYDFVVQDSTYFIYEPLWAVRPLESNSRMPKNYLSSKAVFINYSAKIKVLFLWMHGSYKTLDGSKSFPIDEMYAYYFQNNVVRMISGETRKNVLNTIKRK